LILQGQGSTYDLELQNDGGSVVARVPTGTLAVESSNSSGWKLNSGAASGTNPTLLPDYGSTTTGVGAAASGDVNLIAAGTDMMQVTSSAITFPGITPGSSAKTGYWCYSTGPSFVAESVACISSLEDYKNDLGPIEPTEALSDVMKLRPFWGTWNQKTHPDSDTSTMPFLGARQAAKVDARFGTYEHGKINGIHPLDGVYVAVFQAQQKEIAELETRVAKLEAANDNLRRALAR
jgi:hypothetical protein